METKIATYSAPKLRVQLLKITDKELNLFDPWNDDKFQIRINRRVIYTTNYEDVARKKFAYIITDNIFQKKLNI